LLGSNLLKIVLDNLKTAFPVVDKKLINDKNLIHFKNTVFDLKERTFFDQSSSFFVTRSVGYSFNFEKKPFPHTEAFLNHLADGEADRLEYLERIIYYIVFRCKGRNFMFHFYGKGGTGKTTLTTFLASLVGLEQVTTTTPEKVSNEKFEIANLKGKAIVFILDKKGATFDIQRLKALSGGDIFSGDVKHQQRKDVFIPDPVIVFSTNDSISLEDPSGAIQRRYRPFLIDKKVTEQKTLLQNTESGWVGDLAQERGDFVSYLYSKYNLEDTMQFLDQVEERVSSFQTEFETLRENYNPLIGFVENYLKESNDLTKIIYFGWTKEIRMKKFPFEDPFQNPRDLTLVNGAKDYFLRKGIGFHYNHKNFKVALFQAFEQLNMRVSLFTNTRRMGVQGVEWKEEIFSDHIVIYWMYQRPTSWLILKKNFVNLGTFASFFPVF
jgi:P4 family phage/plasmid primase-like protien